MICVCVVTQTHIICIAVYSLLYTLLNIPLIMLLKEQKKITDLLNTLLSYTMLGR